MAGRNEASTSHSNRNNKKGNENNNRRGETVVVDCGFGKSSCGYCRSPGRTSFSHGLWAQSITVDDYQDLIDRGWRRSGCFLYKTEMEKTCCPSYTIRLKASDFIPSKDQIRTLKRMQRFLDDAIGAEKSMEVIEDTAVSNENCGCTCHQRLNSSGNDYLGTENDVKEVEENFIKYMSEQVDQAIVGIIESGKLPSNVRFPKACIKMVTPSKRKILVQDAEDLLYTSNIAFQISVALKVVESDKNANRRCEDVSPQDIAELLAESLSSVSAVYSLASRACNGHLNFYTRSKHTCPGTSSSVARVCKKEYKRCKRKECCLNKVTGKLNGEKRKMEILLTKSSFDPEEYALYKKYQMKVHNDAPDHVSENSYRRFLVDTPLVYVPPSGDDKVPSCGFGSFHQQYIIDGHLVAVGVIDVLPKCLSSKYLFWDPDYAFLSLGKYSALQEIDWVRRNQATCRSLEYYYLGYYIHSCSKMRYKAAYRPSELLCPLRYQWINFVLARPFLDKKSYVVLSEAILSQAEADSPSPVTVDSQHFDYANGVQNESFIEDDDFAVDPDLESSDDESSSESGCWESDAEDTVLGEILLGIRGSRLRYKNLHRAFALNNRSYLESKLRRYKRVVGDELSKRMVYSLG